MSSFITIVEITPTYQATYLKGSSVSIYSISKSNLPLSDYENLSRKLYKNTLTSSRLSWHPLKIYLV
jgi:hypothetical protein